jgi:hypothetical protein
VAYRIEVTDISDEWGGGHEFSERGGYLGARRVQVDSHPPGETPGSPWLILAHEIGGAVAEAYGGVHAWGGVRGENAARRIAGCPLRRTEGRSLLNPDRCDAP